MASKQKEEPILRFSEEGILFKAKLIGIDAVNTSKGEQMCQKAMERLKSLAKKQEYKQKVILSISLDGLTLLDDKNNKVISQHPIGLVTYLFRDKTETHDFGFVFWVPSKEMKAEYQFIA